jgi:hypothetical protein
MDCQSWKMAEDSDTFRDDSIAGWTGESDDARMLLERLKCLCDR